MKKIESHKALAKNEGYIYIVANKYMPYLVKIGKAKDPKKRVEELSRHEGVPGKFNIIQMFKVFNYTIVETEIHKNFLILSHNDGYGEKTKEFYIVPSAEYAIHLVRRIIKACNKSFRKEKATQQLSLFDLDPDFRADEIYWIKDQPILKIAWDKKHKPIAQKIKSPIAKSNEGLVEKEWPALWWEKKKSKMKK
jgi:hypothetical protein